MKIKKAEEKLEKVKDFESFTLYKVLNEDEQPDHLEKLVNEDG